MKKRMLSVLLAVALVLGLLPGAAMAAGDLGSALPPIVDTAGISWRATDLEGNTITQDTYKGKTQVLVFFSCSGVCVNSAETLQSIAASDWANQENIQVIAIGCNGVDGQAASRELLAAYIAEHGLSGAKKIKFAFMPGDNPRGDDGDGIKAMLGYLRAAGIIPMDSMTIRYATNVILDSAGKLRSAWMGNYTADYYKSVLSLLAETGVEGDTEGYQLYTTAVAVNYAADKALTDNELTLLNAFRAENGQSSLALSATLSAAAMRRAAEIGVYYSHTRPDYSSCMTAAEGGIPATRENIALGQRDCAEVMIDWENSEGHKANMLAQDNKTVGFGCYTASDGRKCWVQLFSNQEDPASMGTGSATQEITAAKNMLELTVQPERAALQAGKSAVFTLSNNNKGLEGSGTSSYTNLFFTSASSADPSVATVKINADGTVTATAVGGGETTLKLGLEAKENGGAPLTKEIPISVSATPITKDMFRVDTSASTYDGTAKTKKITAVGLTENTDYTVTYQNNVNAGTAGITITGKGLYSGTLTYSFQILQAERRLTASATKQLYVGGEAVSISLTDNASGESPKYTYTSGNQAVVTVTAGGKVTPVGAGSATVTVSAAATKNYKGATAEVSFTVSALPTQKLTFATSGNVEKTYGDAAFTNAATNATSGGGAVSYQSDNQAVATVDGAGKVTIKAAGKAVISATAAQVDGKFARTTVSYTLTVKQAKLTISGVTVWDNVFQGKNYTDARVRTVTFTGLVNGDTLTLGTDYTAVAAFEDGLAGTGKKVTGKITMKNPNYTLAQESFVTTGNINKYSATYDIPLVMRAQEGYQLSIDLDEGAWLKTIQHWTPDATLTYTVPGGQSWIGLNSASIGKEKSILTVKAGAGAAASVTTDTVTVTGAGENEEITINYGVTYTEKIPVLLSIEGVADGSTIFKPYDGEPFDLEGWYLSKITAKNAADGTKVAVDAKDLTVAWYERENEEVLLPGAPTEAGEYAAIVTLDTSDGGDEAYYGVLRIEIDIFRVIITITAEDKSAYVGDGEPKYTYKVEGLADGEKLVTEPTVTCPTADMSRAGSYEIVPSGAVAPKGRNGGDNYEDIVYVSGTLTVSTRSGGGGGGGASRPNYAISVSPAAGGKVSVAPQTAVEGQTVTVTVTPDEGYELDELTVTDGKGKAVTISGAKGKYTFVMPASRVTVKATFKKTGEQATETKPIHEAFTDVDANAWYTEAVAYVYEKGIMTGTGKDRFSPYMTASRAMLVTMLYRLEQEPETSGTAFTDVAKGQWYSQGVAWASASGIVAGYGNGCFGPDDPITREQLATILLHYAQYKGYALAEGATLSGYTDGEEVSSYAAEAMAWAVGAKIIGGTDTNALLPGATASRAEIAAMIMRFCETVAK